MEGGGPSELSYYGTPGTTTDVAPYDDLIDELPPDPIGLGAVVRGVLLHNWMAGMSGVELTPQRNGMELIGAAPIIEKVLAIDPAPLGVKRGRASRMIGFCYHFATLHCALLRAKGVPSRTRCGFASYFDPGKWIDHWIVEYWDGERWHLHDPQVGRDDLSADDFHDGVSAWKLCRAGDAEAAVHGNGELWGWDELRGSLVNDDGALNKVDVGGWYWCDLLKLDPRDQPHASVDAELDGVAELAGGSMREISEAFDHSYAIQPPEDVVAR